MRIFTSLLLEQPTGSIRSNITEAAGRGLLRVVAIILVMALPAFAISQVKEDTLIIKNDSTGNIKLVQSAANKQKAIDSANALALEDTVKKKAQRTPHGATVRSAIIPGWGQAYNRKYWKMPIVYGALGATGAVFSYNIKYYKKIRFAYSVVINNDTANIVNVSPELRPLVDAKDVASLRLNRNSFRKNIDYSVLVFLLFWGLNVVDATVDAHLKGFNVTDDLSMKIKPILYPGNAGLSLVFDIHKGKKKLLTFGE